MALRSEGFELTFDPNPSPQYPHGYWTCYAEPGYDGCGVTPLDAMAACLNVMSKALCVKEVEKQ